MQDKILNYTKNPLSDVPDAELKEWLVKHLTSAEDDELFDSIFRDAPHVDDPQGQKDTLTLLESLRRRHRRQSKPAMLSLIAATCLLIAGIGIFLKDASRKPPQKWNAEFASFGQIRDITLCDNSKIWLHNESRVIFPDRFPGKTRRIFADGEIYAEVHADKKHPFIIETEAASVRVTGTSFNLSSYSSGGKVALTLLKGRVEIDIPIPDRKLHFMLEPGDHLTVDRYTGEYSQAKVDVSAFNHWKDSRKLYFIDRPLKEILMELQLAFGTPIIAKDERLLATRYLASFVNNESLEAILDALNTDGKMNIIKRDSTYYLNPNY